MAAPKPFASSADLTEKVDTLEQLAEGVWALTAEGDPNVGAIEGKDFLVAFEARATPFMARKWLDKLREHTDKPVRHLVLSHYHAVRVLGAAAFEAGNIITSRTTAALIEERGRQDWEAEFRRMPRLFQGHEEIPGLTRPTMTFTDQLDLDLGDGRRLELRFLGRGHTEGDIVAWLPDEKICFAGDLVESEAALYTGDAFHRDWSTTTLDRVAALGAETLVGGRGRVARGHAEVESSIGQTRGFLQVMIDTVGATVRDGGSVADAFDRAHAALEPRYGKWPIFEHCMPFNVQRLYDELTGARPRIWTAERDQQVWDALQNR